MEKREFAALHTGSEPLVVFNVWDAGSAVAVAQAGAKVIATGSAGLAGALGYEDGEHIPFAQLVQSARQIAQAVELPISIDIEAGFATGPTDLKRNAAALREVGVIGSNLEDRLIRAGGLRSADEQAERVAAVDSEGLFVNARTDLFLGPLMEGDDPNSDELVDAAIDRASTYRAAGAGCLFVPGLSDPALIARLCKAVDMPVNVMRLPGMASNSELAQLGVARISYGPGPWRDSMAGVEKAARVAFEG